LLRKTSTFFVLVHCNIMFTVHCNSMTITIQAIAGSM